MKIKRQISSAIFGLCLVFFTSFGTMAQTGPVQADAAKNIIEPVIEKCDENINYLSMIEAPITSRVKTVGESVNIISLFDLAGDSVYPQLQAMVAITFPYAPSDAFAIPSTACFLLQHASIEQINSVRLISTDPTKGDLVQMKLRLVTYDAESDKFGSVDATRRVRIDHQKPSVILE